MSEKIKVIHSSPVWLPQTQTWMYNQVKYLPDDIDTHIVCEQTENLDQFEVPNIHLLPQSSLIARFGASGIKGTKALSRIFWAYQMVHKIKPDIVHSHFGTVAWFNALFLQFTKTKHIVTFYGLDVNMVPKQYPKWLRRYHFLFKSADQFLCEGPHMIKQLIAMGCPKEKIKLQHLGIEVDKIAYCPRHWQVGEPLRVLVAASFREKKGIPYALEALAKLQHIVPLEITIIGDATPEPRCQNEKQRILSILEESGLRAKTKLLGYQPHPVLFEEAYKNHIFISPSVTAADGDTEGGAPVSLIEMMATGMPVISTTHCDIPEVVQYGVEDWLVAERDIDELVNKLKWLIENTKEWNIMLDKGRKHIEKNYDVEVQVQRLEEIYDKVLIQGVKA